MLIETMPSLGGKQLYPKGLPVYMDRLSINGKELTTLLSNWVHEESNEKEEQILKDYVLYWLFAPCFKIPKEVLEAAPRLSLHDLINACLNVGLDPF